MAAYFVLVEILVQILGRTTPSRLFCMFCLDSLLLTSRSDFARAAAMLNRRPRSFSPDVFPTHPVTLKTPVYTPYSS